MMGKMMLKASLFCLIYSPPALSGICQYAKHASLLMKVITTKITVNRWPNNWKGI
jgi:hypothetical protein